MRDSGLSVLSELVVHDRGCAGSSAVFKMEKKTAYQMIMSLMPAGIILYLQLTSPGFLEVLYGNPFGVCAMTVCLGIYGLSYWLGKRIVDIEV